MARLSIGEIQQYMRAAGWPESLIVTGAAVFYFESGQGNTNAHNPGNPIGAEDSWGLAQVNTKAWPYSASQLVDPLFNLQVAYQIYLRQGWHAWYNTYYGGKYQQFMPASQAAYGGALSSIGNFVNTNSGEITSGMVGVFLLGLGVLLLIRR